MAENLGRYLSAAAMFVQLRKCHKQSTEEHCQIGTDKYKYNGSKVHRRFKRQNLNSMSSQLNKKRPSNQLWHARTKPRTEPKTKRIITQ
jgi:hypothetical protein